MNSNKDTFLHNRPNLAKIEDKLKQKYDHNTKRKNNMFLININLILSNTLKYKLAVEYVIATSNYTKYFHFWLILEGFVPKILDIQPIPK